MSAVLEISGEQYVPAGIAAKQVGYTSDYVARLAREKKIRGAKIGRQWFVLLSDLQEFEITAAAEKLQRREALRQERKREQQVQTLTPLKERSEQEPKRTRMSVFEKMPTLEVTTVERVVAPRRGVGLSIHSTALLTLIMLMGVSGYLFLQGLDDSAKGPALSLQDEVQTVATRTASAPEFEWDGEHDALTPAYSLEGEVAAFMSNEGTHLATAQQIFSDEVEVTIDPEDPEHAIVTPKFKDEYGTSQRFRMVPVSDEDEGTLEVEREVDETVTGNEIKK